jgi:hypothetical protein
MDHFTPVDTIDTSNFLRAVIPASALATPPSALATLHFLMPVTGFENGGQPVMPKGFGAAYGLFLTIDGSDISNPDGSANTFTSLNITLWADARNNDGTPSVSETSDPAFSNGMANDIALARGTMVSASMSFNPTTMVRNADFVDSMTPTLAGTLLLDGSIKPGTQLEVKTNTPPENFQSFPQSDGGLINLVDGGTAQVTLDPQDTILVPNITHAHLQLADAPRFINGSHDGHHGGDRRGHD